METSPLDHCQDLASLPRCDSVGLDDGKRTFYTHNRL
jgi:hypothetical protein